MNPNVQLDPPVSKRTQRLSLQALKSQGSSTSLQSVCSPGKRTKLPPSLLHIPTVSKQKIAPRSCLSLLCSLTSVLSFSHSSPFKSNGTRTPLPNENSSLQLPVQRPVQPCSKLVTKALNERVLPSRSWFVQRYH
ncbi:hypothetical protein CIPAW_09G156900 [Carya illinoinensis]|uniref:Uncharacterized protein n=1 Tax=Carya illinoinensis TaxID=32201 RepID=A0A8T1PEL7_CARIL|nr:hypothetical protein CIPAW_09G156900 [Carya illinoinensis]